jgi:hypothetical protein
MRSSCLSFLISLICGPAWATSTWIAASNRPQDVQVTIDDPRTVDGDIVVIPSGTVSWSYGVNITKHITLQGSTVCANTGYHGVETTNNAKATDLTTIIDNIADRDSGYFFAIDVPAKTPDTLVRLTGITIVGNGNLRTNNGGAIRIVSHCKKIRIDNCHFKGQLTFNPSIESKYAYWWGLIDHCIWDLNKISSGFSPGEGIAVGNGQWPAADGATAQGPYGDGSWADDSHWGTEQFEFIEDCTFNHIEGGALDSYSGGRAVIRHNWFSNMGTQVHGTETSGRTRGGRAEEVYRNMFNWHQPLPPTGLKSPEFRSGTILFHHNTYKMDDGLSLRAGALRLTVYRLFYPFNVWGGACGVTVNSSTLAIKPNYLDEIATTGGPNLNGVYYDSKATATPVTSSGDPIYNRLIDRSVTFPMNGSLTPTDGSAYVIVNLSQILRQKYGSRNATSSFITSVLNHSTVTVSSQSGYLGNVLTSPQGVNGPNVRFFAGDHYQIRRILVPLDQPGRGKGNVIVGSIPKDVDQPNPNQDLDPCYAWENRILATNAIVDIQSEQPTIKEGRDFYNHSARPVGPQTGDGRRRNGTPIWTAGNPYTEYIYPHPLQRSN